MPHPSITRKEGSGDHVYNASCSSDQNWLHPIRLEILNSLLSSALLTVHMYSQPCNLHTFFLLRGGACETKICVGVCMVINFF